MVVDLLDVDRDRRVVARASQRPLDDARAAARGERDVALGEDRERYPRLLAQPGQRPAAAVQAEQDAVIAGAQRRGHGNCMRSRIDSGEHGDRLWWANPAIRRAAGVLVAVRR
jgi:hypothetical protein